MAIIFTPGQVVALPEWEALVRQHGGDRPATKRTPTKDEQRAADDANDDLDQNPIYRSYLADGSYVEYRTAPNGTDFQIVDYKPSTAFTQAEAKRQQQDQRQQDPGAAAQDRNAAELQRQREKNAALPTEQDPAYETDAERRKRADDRIAQQGRDAEAARQRQRQETADANAAADRAAPKSMTIQDDGKGGKVAVSVMPDGTPRVTPLPGVTSRLPDPARVTVEGTVYERDPQTGSYAPARGLPTSGQATAGGPTMPEIILGQSQAALRDYHTALARDPSLTPEQRAKRFAEAVTVANAANAEHAIAQRERESQRSADYNVANARLGYAQSGLEQALKYTADLNDKLPPGSDLGGKAFAALLGLSMIREAQSGITGLGSRGASPGAPAPAVPTIGPGDLASAAALEAKRQEILAHPAYADPAAATRPWADPNTGPSVLPEYRTPQAPPRVFDGQPGTTAPQGFVAPTGPLPLPPVGTGVGSPGPVSVFDGGGRAQPAPPVRDDWSRPRPLPLPAGAPATPEPMPLPPGMAPAPAPLPLPARVNEPYFPGQAPPGDPRMVEPYVPGQAPPGDPRVNEAAPVGMAPAAMRAQIAATPPWRMTEDQYRWAVDNGLEDDFWRVGGVR